MSWLTNLLSGRTPDAESKPDYYEEGVALLRQERYQEALTSFRLAARDAPGDTDALQQIAVTYTRMGMTDMAVQTYRRVLDMKPDASGAHYGLAFLLLQRDDREKAVDHLQAFLAHPPAVTDAEPHIAHARATLTELIGAGDQVAREPSRDGALS